MAQWRRFERPAAPRGVEFREIEREGIRCRLRWSVGNDSAGNDSAGNDSAGNDRARGGTWTFDDADRARRHETRKASEWIGRGFVEVTPVAGETDTDTPVLDVITAANTTFGDPGFEPVAGFEATYRCHFAPGHRLSHHNYYVLSARGRRAISFNVRADCHDIETVAAFLEFVTVRRDLPFDGNSHHKVALPEPIGRFSHVLFCSPALGQAHVAHPTIAARVASAFPIFDCEIGDADTEVLVDARIHGHGSLTYTRWDREPKPVVDLRFDIRPSSYRRFPKFAVFQPSDLENLLRVLPPAKPDSWLEIRTFRGTVTRFTPATAPTFPAAMADLSRH